MTISYYISRLHFENFRGMKNTNAGFFTASVISAKILAGIIVDLFSFCILAWLGPFLSAEVESTSSFISLFGLFSFPLPRYLFKVHLMWYIGISLLEISLYFLFFFPSNNLFSQHFISVNTLSLWEQLLVWAATSRPPAYVSFWSHVLSNCWDFIFISIQQV